ncbi:MAG: biotin--[acetyl-CoA-carboxylase] ligase [Chlamydiae bacterium RIFCSPLOWO2_02_FULL_45_22]|nr:MAG: biotin--[acetyl-CoA-carboxylase] ligase [Chlamydiae bacterium RIFCSPLOWO2_01_FULL_44_52]OGN69640.1 MAG: biotin--[acetyl-CoA-carboxylase] ligase [Chlamydiae bacterium RIFCSPLOWO2_02_FULL_45_22]
MHFESLDSTNVYAKTNSGLFSQNDITCVTADEQTKGRGRFDRTWFSPKGVNIYATFYFTLPKTTRELVAMSQVMAMSLSTLLKRKGLHPEIKWPNDVRLNHKKVAGILSETRFSTKIVEFFVGIGINVNLDEVASIDQPATSLKIETGRIWDRKALLKELQVQFESDLALFKRDGFEPFHDDFEALLCFKGQRVRCFDGETTWEGICHSITRDGQLNLRLENGIIHTVLSGDIV